jgi:hypothetical protein
MKICIQKGLQAPDERVRMVTEWLPELERSKCTQYSGRAKGREFGKKLCKGSRNTRIQDRLKHVNPSLTDSLQTFAITDPAPELDRVSECIQYQYSGRAEGHEFDQNISNGSRSISLQERLMRVNSRLFFQMTK